MGLDDMRKPCKRFIKELTFQKIHDKEANIEANNSRYQLLDLVDLVQKSRAAIKIHLKVNKVNILET